jgi:hypothetical protein
MLGQGWVEPVSVFEDNRGGFDWLLGLEPRGYQSDSAQWRVGGGLVEAGQC